MASKEARPLRSKRRQRPPPNELLEAAERLRATLIRDAQLITPSDGYRTYFAARGKAKTTPQTAESVARRAFDNSRFQT